MASKNARSIELHIEELLLHSFSPGDQYHIGEAVEQELSRLLADRGVLGRRWQRQCMGDSGDEWESSC